MRRLLIAVFAMLACIGNGSPSSADDAAAMRVPYVLADDFEAGELNAWESYPIAEDPGFDPEIWCVKEPTFRGSSYSLCKVIKPNDTDYPIDENLVGMTKKMRLTLRSGSEARFAAFMGGDRRATEIRITLYGSDGRRYIWSRANPPANEWVEVRADMSMFRVSGGTGVPAAGIGVEAVAVVARYGPVSPYWSYSLCIDDFSLSGERPARFAAVEPSSVYLDKFYTSVLTRHIRRGEALSLSVKPEGSGTPIQLASVTCTVYDSRKMVRVKNAPLNDSGVNGDAAKGDGVWSSASIYTAAADDPAGRWTLSLEGVAIDGSRIKDDLAVIMPVKRLTPEDHPRLFFTRAGLDSIKTGLADPKRKKVFDAAIASAKRSLARGNIDDMVEASGPNLEFLVGGPVSPTWDFLYRWTRPGNTMREVVTSGAFLYAFTGDREAGLKAREFMLRFASFKGWMSPWFLNRHMYGYYPIGQWSYAMAIGYDLLYPLLTSDDRTAIRKAVMEKALILHYRDHVELNRKPSNITNHIGMNTTGILLSALAFMGEDPENPDMEPYLSGFLAKYRAHIDAAYRPDGSYAEPEGYAGTDTEDLVKCLDAIERNLGMDWTTTTNVRGSYLYQLYLSTLNGLACPAFGDGGRDWGFALRNLHLWLAHRTNDPSALERYLWQTESGAFSPQYTFFDLLWMPDPELKPKPLTDYPPSRWFQSKGNAVFRSGWDENALIFAMKCGPHSNHYHLDQGTFWLLYHGETLLSEAGYTNYYRNLYYRQYYIQPVAHNTLILNRYPESQRIADLDDEVKARNEYPRILSCATGPFVDETEAEMSCVYKGRLSKYTRSVVYMRPDYLVMCDDVAANEPERYTWVFHADGKDSFKGGGATVRIVRPKADLRMEVLAPEVPERTINMDPDRDASFIYLTDPAAARTSRFLAVLIPSCKENAADRDSWKIRRIDGDGWIGSEIERKGETDRVFFRTVTGGSRELPGGYTTDGDRIAVTMSPDGALKRFWARHATSCAGKDGVLFASTVPATMSLKTSDSVLDADLQAEVAAKISLATGAKPREVLVDGVKVKAAYDAKRKTATVSLTPGTHTIKVAVR